MAGTADIMLLILLAAVLTATPALACEPVVPLAVLYAGEFSLAAMARSAPFFIVVVAVKCAAFAWFSRRLLSWHKAAVLMLVANIASTAIGIIASMPFAVPAFIVVAIPIVFAVSLLPARRYSHWLNGQLKFRVSARAVAGIATAIFISSIVLFGQAQGLLASRSGAALGWYWAAKLLYIYLALLLSVALTIYVEDSVVSALARREGGESTPYLAAVARTNLAALLLITLVGAIAVLPARFRSPDFLISW